MKPQPMPPQRLPRRHGPARAAARGTATTAFLPRPALAGALLAGWLGLAAPLQAQPGGTPTAASAGAKVAATPKAKVVLTVQGFAPTGQPAPRKDFDMAMLEALPQHSFRTATPWFKEPRTFSGPLLREVLATAGVQGSELRAVALNNYKVSIPMDDVAKWDMVLATRLDGQPMAVRDKGPLFIIYPFHAHEVLRSERFYSRSAWQLRTLEVK